MILKRKYKFIWQTDAITRVKGDKSEIKKTCGTNEWEKIVRLIYYTCLYVVYWLWTDSITYHTISFLLEKLSCIMIKTYHHWYSKLLQNTTDLIFLCFFYFQITSCRWPLRCTLITNHFSNRFGCLEHIDLHNSAELPMKVLIHYCMFFFALYQCGEMEATR